MSVSFKYWDDCVDPEDMQLMWEDADVSKEWREANEKMGKKVHLSRDPDGQTYLTQTEMNVLEICQEKFYEASAIGSDRNYFADEPFNDAEFLSFQAVAKITFDRHFKSQIEPEMVCALAEILSDRQLFAQQYDKKAKETKIGIMQLFPSTAEWLVSEMGYRNYNIEEDPSMLYRPFVNVYLGAAYIIWLSNHDGKERSEEYVVRAYKGGINKATHKSTMDYFQRYLSVKHSLPTNMRLPDHNVTDLTPGALRVDVSASGKAGNGFIYWESRVSHEDMEDMWKNPDVFKEWTKSGERRGRVRFSHDAEKRPYLSRVEVMAVAKIIISRHFNSKGVQPTALAALAEVCSMRFVNGVRARTGLMGIDYPTAVWLYRDIGARAYKVKSVVDLYNPFVSMYFAATYLAWLSEYEGRERSHQFIVQAYLGGPDNVNLQETGPLWKQFKESLSNYQDPKKPQGSCCIL